MSDGPKTFDRNGFRWALVRDCGLGDESVYYTRTPLNTPNPQTEQVTGKDVPLVVRYYFAVKILTGEHEIKPYGEAVLIQSPAA